MEGLVQIYWGNGKGKTTAALGTALRACGAGLSVHLVQFMKNTSNPEAFSGEIKALEKFPNFSSKIFGPRIWFTPNPKTQEEKAQHIKKANEALSHLKSSLNENYDIIIADEILYALQFSLLAEKDIIDLIKNRPKSKELILTGSHMPFPNIFDLADLITEVRKQKHPYDEGIKARKGIEF